MEESLKTLLQGKSGRLCPRHPDGVGNRRSARVIELYS
jgi:hypothetical protein